MGNCFRLTSLLVLISHSVGYSVFEWVPPVNTTTSIPVHIPAKGPGRPEVISTLEPVIVLELPSSRADVDWDYDLAKASSESVSDADVMDMVTTEVLSGVLDDESISSIKEAAKMFPRCDPALIRAAVDVALELSSLYVGEPRGEFGVELRDMWSISGRLLSDWSSEHIFEIVLLALACIISFSVCLYFVLSSCLENRQNVALLRR